MRPDIRKKGGRKAPPPIEWPIDPVEKAEAWFRARGWEAHDFQREVWRAQLDGESGLLAVPTGSGKTYAATLAALCAGLRVIYLSPLRAMARDLHKALTRPVDELGLGLRVETRTSDTGAHIRSRQRDRLPDVLITTPESLSMLLTWPDAAERFAGLGLVVVDEWHELIDNKRGSQTELALARLRRFSPGLRTWALSATVGNVHEAAQAVVGTDRPYRLVHAKLERPILLRTLLPEAHRPLPWSGHFGTTHAPRLGAEIDPARPTLVFCNTRAQAELWYQALVLHDPSWFEWMGLHHGSIDSAERARVEDGLKDGSLRLVVCTASLDLGVDLAPVDLVAQIGSPKAVARLIQRAGRAAHRPGATAEVLCVPTHALQLFEIVACRDAIARGEVEPRTPHAHPLDVLAQHIVTCGLGGGFRPDALYAEVRSAWSYRNLGRAEFDRALLLVTQGGATLAAYPDFRKVVPDAEGQYGVPDERIARLHRASVGTIVADTTIAVNMAGRGVLGSIDEGFIAALRPGESFVFAGERLELIGVRGLTAFVKKATGRSTRTVHWPGDRLPITGALGHALRRVLHEAGEGRRDTPELVAAADLLAAQASLSTVPCEDMLLAEAYTTEAGQHLYLFPFEGRKVHEGIGALIALRVGRVHPTTFTIATDDHGLELLHPEPLPWADLLGPALFSADSLVDDILASVHISELMRRRFREIARVAGFINPGNPWELKSARQVQASASLLYDVFTRYDPGNPLLDQARREVIQQHFEEARLGEALARLRGCRVVLNTPVEFTPLAMPLRESGLTRNTATTETRAQRVARLARPGGGGGRGGSGGRRGKGR